MPITSEEQWAGRLATLPLWRAPVVPTLVIAPHPDDESLAVGGLIAHLREAGAPVTVVAVTDGENCYPGETGLSERRIAEQEAALARLGVPAAAIRRIGLEDSGVAGQEADLERALESLARENAHIVAPWPNDFHPDHEAAGRAAQAIAERHGLPLTWYFFWTWHRGTPELLEDLPLVKFALSEGQIRAKRAAVQCHVSQLEHPSGHPILPADILQPAWRTFEVFLPAC